MNVKNIDKYKDKYTRNLPVNTYKTKFTWVHIIAIVVPPFVYLSQQYKII
jgi:hypothetical protein